ncbi:16S rRNA (guanine(527)-N(7))-methyltransferase RsmG [Paenibacillus tarimensis]
MEAAKNWFEQQLSEHGISLTEQQLRQFERYYELLVEWNEKMNLTGITERESVYEKHFFDSVSIAFYTDMKQVISLADIGSGAGFPSIPLKICFPHLKVTIVDSLNKRIQFLNHLCDELKLQSVLCLHGRAEDVARMKEHRDGYDIVTARAVAKLAVLNEFCLPFVRRGGYFVAMKGTNPQDEVNDAARSLKELKGHIVKVNQMSLPFEQSERHMIWVEKLGATPRIYPRKAGVPLKQPLL